MQPKLLPLVETLGNRYQSLLVDPRLVNGFAEVGQQEKEVFVYKRPAFKAFQALGAGTARGLFNWRGDIYAIVNGTVFKNGGALGTAVNNAGTYSFTSCLGVSPVLLIQNGTNAYTINPAGAIVVVSNVNYPAATVAGVVYLDGTLYVMDASGNITGSTAAANDPLTWDPLNLIRAQIEPTSAIYLAKQLVYIFALKTGYSEAFYDAGNAVGSPLAPVAGAKLNYGCVDAGTVRDVGGDLIWVANSNEGYPCVIKVSSLKGDIISTPPIERLLASASASYYSWNIRIEGHRLYGITSVGANFTLVYDLTSQIWYQWTDVSGNFIPYVFSCQGAGSAVVFLHRTSGNLCTLDVGTYTDSGDAPFPVDIYTPNFDDGTRLYKILSNMTVVGDQVAGTTLSMRYSDDDYTTWNGPFTIDMGLDRPTVTDLGSFTKRAFRLTHQANTPFRVKAIELYLSAGIAP